MINLIRGDIRRILSKKTLWFAFILALLGDFGLVMFALFYMKYSTYNYALGTIAGVADLGGMIIGIAVFLAVYADDFRSMSIISAIGRGQPRWKIVIAKFINSVIITSILFAIFTVEVFVLMKIMGMELLPDELIAMYMGVFKGLYVTIGYVTIAAIFIYARGNIAFSVFMVVMLYLILPSVIDLSSMLPVLKDIHLERYDYNGFANSGLSSIFLGMGMSGVLTLILGFIIYVGGSLAIIYTVFRKKELDF